MQAFAKNQYLLRYFLFCTNLPINYCNQLPKKFQDYFLNILYFIAYFGGGNLVLVFVHHEHYAAELLPDHEQALFSCRPDLPGRVWIDDVERNVIKIEEYLKNNDKIKSYSFTLGGSMSASK